MLVTLLSSVSHHARKIFLEVTGPRSLEGRRVLCTLGGPGGAGSSSYIWNEK